MRIIGGKFRGRPLKTPDDLTLRPTSDRVREATFNILVHKFTDTPLEDAAVIDVFAGVGALGLEALSRNAAHATFIDNGDEAIKCIHANAGKLCDVNTFTVLKLDATRLPPPPLKARAPCAIAFLDPPYESGLAAPALLNLAKEGWIGEDAVLVVEVAAMETFEAPLGFAIADERTYGSARVIFLRRTS